MKNRHKSCTQHTFSVNKVYFFNYPNLLNRYKSTAGDL